MSIRAPPPAIQRALPSSFAWAHCTQPRPDPTRPRDPSRREMKFVADGIKYTDPLRAYDVASFEALSLAETVAAPTRQRARPTPGESSGSSEMGSSQLGSSRGPSSMGGGSWTAGSGHAVGLAWSSSAGSSAVSTPRLHSRAGSSRAMTSGFSRGSSCEGSDDASSSLTFGDGVLVCGNPTQALRAKRRQAGGSSNASSTGSSGPGSPSTQIPPDLQPQIPSQLRPLPPGTPPGRPGSAPWAAGGPAACLDGELESELLKELYQYKLQQAMHGEGLEAEVDGGTDGDLSSGAWEGSALPGRLSARGEAQSAADREGGRGHAGIGGAAEDAACAAPRRRLIAEMGDEAWLPAEVWEGGEGEPGGDILLFDVPSSPCSRHGADNSCEAAASGPPRLPQPPGVNSPGRPPMPRQLQAMRRER